MHLYLDMGLMILVIAYGIMKIIKSLGLEMSYSMKIYVQRSVAWKERGKGKYIVHSA